MMDAAPVRWAESRDAVDILDQTRLPDEERRVLLRSAEEAADAIRRLMVRGAPAIGITAAMAYALEAAHAMKLSPAEFRARLHAAHAILAGARPTAVNLRWALDRVARVMADDEEADNGVVACRMWGEATAIADEDRALCRRIGEHALELFPGDGELRLLTHCNAGVLATGGIGTATAPMYLARERGRAVRVWATETRPLLQGSRLTAWELSRAGIDVKLVIDSVAALVLRERNVDAVIVGADRIAANGDVANKVGTYALAVLARHHGVPFYVAAPRSTVDLATACGADIPIEHRDPDEVRRGFGRATAPADVPVFAPAFDITPASCIDAIITDGGVRRPPYDGALAALFTSDGGAT